MKRTGQSIQDGGTGKKRSQQRTGMGEPCWALQDAEERGMAMASQRDTQHLGGIN